MLAEEKYVISVCLGTSCNNNLSRYVYERALNEVQFRKLPNITIEKTVCMGNCQEGPNVKIKNETTGEETIQSNMRSIDIANTIKAIALGQSFKDLPKKEKKKRERKEKTETKVKKS